VARYAASQRKGGALAYVFEALRRGFMPTAELAAYQDQEGITITSPVGP